jgi:hypothetical protein
MAPISKSKMGRGLKLAGIVTAALVGLLAGASYLNHESPSYRQETKVATGPIAPYGIPRPAFQGVVDSPVSTKSISLDLLGTLDAARLAMVHGHLSDARARLAMLPAGQDQRIDIRQITNELVQRELARDAALGLARTCEKAGDIPCVLRSAGDALASDVSDSEAREMLLRAVAQTGLTPGVRVNASRPVDPPKVTHRRSSERLNLRRESQALANNNDIYAKH